MCTRPLGSFGVDKIRVAVCDGKKLWGMFAPYHYLRSDYFGHGALVAILDDKLVGFTSFISFPSGTIEQPARRGHRTVILPDYQGMGIGVKLSDFLGEYCLVQGFRFFSKTSHPRMGAYRDQSPLWKPTSKNGVMRSDGGGVSRSRWEVRRVASYSHEFVGADETVYAMVLEGRVKKDDGQASLFD